jgi:isoleucyl-tRNA synthetase
MPYLGEDLYRSLVGEVVEGAAPSVHLAEWPKADESLVDEELLEATDLLLRTVSLGRSARKAASLRVRQPLSEILVRAPRAGAQLRQFVDELRDELNVKQVRFLEAADTVVQHRLRPNLPVVGKKRGRLVPSITRALSGLRGEAATAVAIAAESGRTFELAVDGQALEMSPDEVLVDATSPEGYQVAEEGGLLVALNTTLTPELVLEGQARDLVRFVQDARRAAGFDISDRIVLTLAPSPGLDLDALLAAHGAYVAAETLATSVSVGEPSHSAHVVEAELDTGKVLIGVKRVG